MIMHIKPDQFCDQTWQQHWSEPAGLFPRVFLGMLSAIHTEQNVMNQELTLRSMTTQQSLVRDSAFEH